MTLSDNKFNRLGNSLGFLLAVGAVMLDKLSPVSAGGGPVFAVLAILGLILGSRKAVLVGAMLGFALVLFGAFYYFPDRVEEQALIYPFLSLVMMGGAGYLCLLGMNPRADSSEAHKDREAEFPGRLNQLEDALDQSEKDRDTIQLHKDVAMFSNENRPVEEAMHFGIERVCKETGWPVGHVYFPKSGSMDKLLPSGIWYLEDAARFETFRKITEDTPLTSGEGLPGRVTSSGKPAWIMDVTKDSNFPRAKLAKDIGVRAGFAFPILIEKEVVGVMEFFSEQAAEPDAVLLETMGNIGTQLGRVLERHRSQNEQKILLGKLEGRIKELKCMYDATNLIRTAANIEDVFNSLGAVIALGLRYPDSVCVKIIFDDRQYVTRNFETTPWKYAGDIIVEGENRGRIDVYYHESGVDKGSNEILEEERALINNLANLLSESIKTNQAQAQRETSRKQLRKLYNRLELVREEERKRIAREVHDELGQVLTTLKLELSLLEGKLDKEDNDYGENTGFMRGLIDDTIQAVKQISSDLRPPILDVLGLIEALRWQGQEFAKRTGIRFELQTDPEEIRLDSERSTTLFRIFQETLTNVARHAKARNVKVTIIEREGNLEMRVRDDGIGIGKEKEGDPHSLGLLGIRERVLVWNGRVEFIGVPGEGTTVTIDIKL